MRHIAHILLLTIGLLTAGCTVEEIIEHGSRGDNFTTRDADTPSADMATWTELDPRADPALGGPAAELLIDASVHQGTYADGQPYEGLRGQPFAFAARDYPLHWAIAAVHGSRTLRARGIDASPNHIIAAALQHSRLACHDEPLPQGCLGLSDSTHWALLAEIFPERFGSLDHSAFVSGDKMVTSVHALVHLYLVFDVAMLRYHDNPPAFYSIQPETDGHALIMQLTQLQSLWWEELATIFTDCTQDPILDCVASPSASADHLESIAAIQRALDAQPGFDARFVGAQLFDYWDQLRPMYDESVDALIRQDLQVHIRDRSDAQGQIGFQDDLGFLLERLDALLPAPASAAEIRARLCAASYLEQADCTP